MAGIWNPVFLMCALLLYVAIQDVNGRPQNNGEQPVFTGAVTSNPAWQPPNPGPVVPYSGSGNNGGGSCCCVPYPGSGGNGGSPGTPGQLNLPGTIELLEHILVKGKEVSQILNKVTGTAETRDNLNQVLQSLGQLISLLRSAQTMKLTRYQIDVLYYIQSIFMYPLLVCTYNLNALLKVIDKLKGLNLQMLDELVKSISGKLSVISNSLATLYGGMNELIRYLSFILDSTVDAVTISIDSVTEPVLDTLNGLSTQLKEMITEIRTKLGYFKQSDNANLQEILNCLGILPVVENLLGAVLAVLGGDESKLTVVNQLLNTLKELVGEGILGDLLGGLLGGLFSVVHVVLTLLSGVLGGALLGTLALVDGLLNTVTTALGSVTGVLDGVLNGANGGGLLGGLLGGGGQGGHNGGRGGGLLGGLLSA